MYAPAVLSAHPAGAQAATRSRYAKDAFGRFARKQMPSHFTLMDSRGIAVRGAGDAEKAFLGFPQLYLSCPRAKEISPISSASRRRNYFIDSLITFRRRARPVQIFNELAVGRLIFARCGAETYAHSRRGGCAQRTRARENSIRVMVLITSRLRLD